MLRPHPQLGPAPTVAQAACCASQKPLAYAVFRCPVSFVSPNPEPASVRVRFMRLLREHWPRPHRAPCVASAGPPAGPPGPLLAGGHGAV